MKKHRFLALLLAVFLAIGWLPVSVSAEEADFLNPVEICFILTPDGTSVWDSCQVEFGTSYYDWYEALPEPERAGFTFDGWSTFALAFRAFDPAAPINESGSEVIYLYGFWTEDVSRTLTFFVDGEFYDEITTEDGSLPQMPQNPEREDRVFKQWLREDGEPFVGTVTEDASLYAGWYDSVITYDPNGNLEDTPFEMLRFGADMEDPTPAYPDILELDDYIFLGWDPEVAETVEESTTYTAKWEPRPRKTFTLTYKANTDDPVAGLPETNPEVFTTYDLDMETHLFPVAPVLTRTGFLCPLEPGTGRFRGKDSSGEALSSGEGWDPVCHLAAGNLSSDL